MGEYWDGMVTGMLMAALNGHTACVEQLIAAGADPNKAHSTKGVTPLWMAAMNGDEAVVARLLAPGAGTDPNQARTDDGATPLYIAAQKGREAVVAQLLALGVGTDPNQAKTDSGATPLCKLILITGGADRTVKKKNGETAAAIAARKGHTALAKLLK